MTTLKAFGTLLTASTDDRTLTYRLLPFGEEGRTSAGKVTASKGTITLPEDHTTLVANMEHDATRPVGRFVSVEEADDGLNATVRVLNTTAGNDLLIEAAEGVRTGISVEIDSPVIRSGALLGGALTGAGFVTSPAFPSAQLVAADAGDLPDEIEINGQIYTKTPEAEPVEDEAAEAAQEGNTVTNTVTAAAAPAGLNATATKGNETLDAAGAFKALAQGFRTGKVNAALTNIVHDDGDNDGDGLGEIAAAPSWLGEVYSKAAYVRKYIPLITQGTLTSLRESGFAFGTLPVVAKYAGNKTDVPTGGMTVTPLTYLAERWAHAADIDRRFIDFGDTTVVRAFLEAQIESYKKVTDIDVLVNLFGKANVFTPGTVPTDINKTLAAIVDGALSLIGNDFNPTFAIVGSDLYRDFALTPKDLVPEYLSSTAGLEVGSANGFKIIPSSHANALGNVLVGDGSTVRYKELGGGSPVRVEAEHIAQGGKDFGIFGYTSFQELVDGGVVKADITP